MAAVVLVCTACNEDAHAECHVTTQDQVGQYAACGCRCGGGLEAFRDGVDYAPTEDQQQVATVTERPKRPLGSAEWIAQR